VELFGHPGILLIAGAFNRALQAPRVPAAPPPRNQNLCFLPPGTTHGILH